MKIRFRQEMAAFQSDQRHARRVLDRFLSAIFLLIFLLILIPDPAITHHGGHGEHGVKRKRAEWHRDRMMWSNLRFYLRDLCVLRG